MRARVLLLALLAYHNGVAASIERPRVYIHRIEQLGISDDPNGYRGEAIQQRLSFNLGKLHECARFLTSADVNTMLRWDKERALLGNAAPSVLEEIGAQLNTQWLITGKVTRLGNADHVQIILWDTKRVKQKVNATATIATNTDQLPNDVLKQIIAALPTCQLTLKIFQMMSSEASLGALSGEVPLEMNYDGDVSGDGEMSGAIVPKMADETDAAIAAKIMREGRVALKSLIHVEGRRDDQNRVHLTISGRGSMLKAGGSTIASQSSGTVSQTLEWRAGEDEWVNWGGTMTKLELVMREVQPPRH